jgi:hypothetical protein
MVIAMSKMSNHIVRQREAGIDVRENLTEEIIIVQSAVLTELRRIEKVVTEVKTLESFVPGTDSWKLMEYMKELEEAWDKIKRSVKGEGYGEDYQAERG